MSTGRIQEFLLIQFNLVNPLAPTLSYTATRDFTFVDCSLFSQLNAAAGTITVSSTSGAITVLPFPAVSVLVRPTAITTANTQLTAGDALILTASHANMLGYLTCFVLPPSAASQVQVLT